MKDGQRKSLDMYKNAFRRGEYRNAGYKMDV